MLAEIPYSLVAGSIYYCCWWFGFQGYRSSTSSFASGFLYLCICLFELYYVSFGQAIAAFAPNELLASLLVPIFFLFVVSFCGVVVPPSQLPTFWRSWMWHLTPFTYLLEAMLGVSLPFLYQSCYQEDEVKLTQNSRSSSTTNQFDAIRASLHDS